jgi:hypothetical protein
MQDSFDANRWEHWLVVMAYIALSSWILWKVYLRG